MRKLNLINKPDSTWNCDKTLKYLIPTYISNYGMCSSCADPESFVRAGPNLTFFPFLQLMRGEIIQIPNKRALIKMAFRWWADDGPTLNACLVVL